MSHINWKKEKQLVIFKNLEIDFSFDKWTNTISSKFNENSIIRLTFMKVTGDQCIEDFAVSMQKVSNIWSQFLMYVRTKVIYFKNMFKFCDNRSTFTWLIQTNVHTDRQTNFNCHVTTLLTMSLWKRNLFNNSNK